MKEFDNITLTLDENIEYLKAIDILIHGTNLHKEDKAFIKTELTKIHNSPIKASILSEALFLITDKSLEFEILKYDKEFFNRAKIITEKISQENYFKYYILKQLERLSEDNKSAAFIHQN